MKRRHGRTAHTGRPAAVRKIGLHLHEREVAGRAGRRRRGGIAE